MLFKFQVWAGSTGVNFWFSTIPTCQSPRELKAIQSNSSAMIFCRWTYQNPKYPLPPVMSTVSSGYLRESIPDGKGTMGPAGRCHNVLIPFKHVSPLFWANKKKKVTDLLLSGITRTQRVGISGDIVSTEKPKPKDRIRLCRIHFETRGSSHTCATLATPSPAPLLFGFQFFPM